MYAPSTNDTEANYPTSLLFAGAPGQSAASGGAGKGHMTLQQIAPPHAAEPSTISDEDEDDAEGDGAELASHTEGEGGQAGDGIARTCYFPVILFLAAVGDGQLAEPDTEILEEQPREFLPIPPNNQPLFTLDHRRFGICSTLSFS